MFSAGERRLLEQRLDEEQQDLLNKLSTDFTQNIVQPTKGAISNREMELLQQASPEASPTSSNVDIAKAIDALMQQLQSSKERLL